MIELNEISSWNLELIGYVKEFTFDAGLPVLLLILSCVCLWLCIFLKFTRLLFTFASLFITVICYKKTPDILSKPLLSSERKTFQNERSVNTKPEFILYPLPNCIQKINGIVVLGGGIYHKNIPSVLTQTRLLGLMSLLQTSKKEWASRNVPIIFSGGVTNKSIDQSESEAMKEFINYIYKDNPSNLRIITEKNSKNTYQNSAYSKEIFDKNHFDKKIILITSSYHMFRAKRTFEKQGFSVCPIPVTSYEIEGGGIFNFSNAIKSIILFNEYFGIVGYAIKGWLKV